MGGPSVCPAHKKGLVAPAVVAAAPPVCMAGTDPDMGRSGAGRMVAWVDSVKPMEDDVCIWFMGIRCTVGAV